MGRRTTGQLLKRGGTWYVRYTHLGHTRAVSLGTDNKTQAKKKRDELLRPFSAATEADQRREALAAMEAAQDVARRADAEANRIPLAQVWQRFPYDHTAPGRGNRRPLAPRNVAENRTGWSKFTRWLTDSHPTIKFMEEVTPELARAWVRHLEAEERLTGGRINKLVTIGRNMYRLADRPPPFVGLQRQAVHHESRTFLEVDQLKAVCSSATGELRRLLAVMLYTGLRLGDAVTLEWSHMAGGRVSRVMAKTRKAVAFPIHPELEAVLAEVPECDRTDKVCPELAAEYCRNHTRISQRIRAHFQRQSVVVVEKVEGRKRQVSRRGAHAFRHSFVTLAARAGVPVGIVRQWVGHSSELVTRIYEHWGTEGQDRILAALPSMGWATAVPVTPPALPPGPAPEVSPAAPDDRIAAAIAVLEAATSETWEASRGAALQALRCRP